MECLFNTSEVFLCAAQVGYLVIGKCYKSREGLQIWFVDSKEGLEVKPWHDQGINLLGALELILKTPAAISAIR